MRVVRIACLLLLTLAMARPLLAQPATGSVGGSVSASTGIGLPGATVTAGDDGEYLIEGLPLGDKYELRAELDGFAPVSRIDLTSAATSLRWRP